jgi:hypothetical protein
MRRSLILFTLSAAACGPAPSPMDADWMNAVRRDGVTVELKSITPLECVDGVRGLMKSTKLTISIATGGSRPLRPDGFELERSACFDAAGNRYAYYPYGNYANVIAIPKGLGGSVVIARQCNLLGVTIQPGESREVELFYESGPIDRISISPDAVGASGGRIRLTTPP